MEILHILLLTSLFGFNIFKFLNLAETVQVTIKGSNLFYPCHYFNEDIIDCTYFDFDSIPEIIPEGKRVTKFLIAGSKIITLNPDAFSSLKNLTEIIIERTRLTEISSTAFKGLSHLTHLTIKVETDVTNQLEVNIKLLLSTLISLTNLIVYNVKILTLPSGLTISSRLAKIEMDKTGTKTIAPDAFEICASNLETILLFSQVDLTVGEINSWLRPLKALKTLQIEGSDLTTFPSLPSNINKLHTLSLSKNKIQSIHSTSFTNMRDTLTKLDLSFNQLIDNELGGLDTLTRLETLYLNENPSLTKIPSGVRALVNLVDFNMQYCNLLGIEAEDFPIISKLKSLDIGYNTKFKRITSEAFSRISSLETFALDGLEISQTVVDDSVGNWVPVFSKLVNLVRLRMMKCNAGDSLWTFISDFPRKTLVYLGLSSNHLTKIPDLFFQSFESLEQLDLSKNSLSKISYESFFGLPITINLNLKDNKLETINNCTFAQFLSYENIHLSGNPVICDCRLSWLVEKKPVDFLCGSPADMIDKSFRSLTVDSLVCPNGQSPDKQCIISKDQSFTTLPPDTAVTTAIKKYEIYISALYNKDIQSATLEMSISRQISEEFNSFTIEYHREHFEDFKNVTWNPKLLKYELKNILPGYNYTFCVVMWKNGVKHNYKYNCDVLDTSKTKTNFAAIIGGSIAGILVILIIIATVLAIKCRRKPQKSPHSGSNNSGANTTQESVYDYDYPSFPAVGQKSTESRIFVRAKSEVSSLGGGTRATMFTDFEDNPHQQSRSHLNGGHPPQHHWVHPANGNQRAVQSTFNLPQHYSTSRMQHHGGPPLSSNSNHDFNFFQQDRAGRSISMDWLDRGPDRMQGRHLPLPPRPITSAFGEPEDSHSIRGGTLPPIPLDYEPMEEQNSAGDASSYYIGMQDNRVPSYQPMQTGEPQGDNFQALPSAGYSYNPESPGEFYGGGGPYAMSGDLSQSYPVEEPPEIAFLSASQRSSILSPNLVNDYEQSPKGQSNASFSSDETFSKPEVRDIGYF